MVLIRMCLRTNKVLLATSGAMQALVFFVATNLETVNKIYSKIAS